MSFMIFVYFSYNVYQLLSNVEDLENRFTKISSQLTLKWKGKQVMEKKKHGNCWLLYTEFIYNNYHWITDRKWNSMAVHGLDADEELIHIVTEKDNTTAKYGYDTSKDTNTSSDGSTRDYLIEQWEN